MLTSFFSFLNAHLKEPRKRRASDTENECPSAKQVKYQSERNKCSISTMAEVGDDNELDEEVTVVEEIRKVERIAPRQLISRRNEMSLESTPVSAPSSSQEWRSLPGRPRLFMTPDQFPDPEVQVLSTIRHIPVQQTGKAAKKSVSEKIFGPFKAPSTRFTQAMKKKQVNQAPNFKRALEEKMTYMKLLEMHQRKSPFQIAPFTVTDIQSRSPIRNRQVPIVDLEAEMKSLRVYRGNESTPSTSSSRALDQQSNNMEVVEKKKRTPVQPPKPINSLQDYLKLYSFPDVNQIYCPEAKSTVEEIKRTPVQPLKPVNSLQDYLKLYSFPVNQILSDHAINTAEKRRQARLEESRLAILSAHNEKTMSDALEDRVREHMKITVPPVLEIEEEEPKYILPELTSEQEDKVRKALKPVPADEVLAKKFNLTITRKDMVTLRGLNWLNDEVVNFYMELLINRGKNDDSLPKVYAFNTFFYQNIIVKGCYAKVRRWTRKVDIFAHDMVFIPIHLGMHWCMSVVDFVAKEIRYYDSMGSHNDACLNAIMDYLEEESIDKRKQPFDSTGWEKINAERIPQQMNGSDCGVFACVFAEHLARNAPLLFSQENMPYFRRKMVLEILEGSLLT